MEKIKRKAADNGESSVRPKIDLPSEVAYQLGRLSDEHQQMAQALQVERNKVDLLAKFVKSLYGAFRSAFPYDEKFPLAPFPNEILDHPDAYNDMMGEASPANSAEGTNRPGTSSANIWNEPGCISAHPTVTCTVSPTSSPTTTDFPLHVPPPHGHRPQSSTRPNRRQSLPQVAIPAAPRIDDASLRSGTAISSPNAYDEGYDTYGSASSSQPSFDNDGRSSGPKRQRVNRISIKTTGLSSPGPSPLSAISMPYNISPHDASQQGYHFPAREPVRRLARARSDSAPHGISLAKAWQHNQSFIRVDGESNIPSSSTNPGCFIVNYPSSDAPSVTSKREGEPWIARSRSTSQFRPAVLPAQKLSKSSMSSSNQFTIDTGQPNAHTSTGARPVLSISNRAISGSNCSTLGLSDGLGDV